MVYTFEVLKPLKSRDANDVQPMNMADMSVTFEVLRGLRSRDVNDLQP